MTDSILDIISLRKAFYKKANPIFNKDKNSNSIVAVDGVSLSIKEGEILGLVGESGCGKTTLTRLILKLLTNDSGDILYQGKSIYDFDRLQMKEFRKRVRKISQHPEASLNPGMKIKEIIAEVYDMHTNLTKKEKIVKVTKVLFNLGLKEDHLDRYPHELSSGQKKRISIARALALPPELLLADEPFSGIDASRINDILTFLLRLKRRHKMSILFISHDIDTVAEIADRIAVMYDGSIMEIFHTQNSRVSNQSHPYTKKLFDSKNFEGETTLGYSEESMNQEGRSESTGCKYINFCELYRLRNRPEICEQRDPKLREIAESHLAACHFL